MLVFADAFDGFVDHAVQLARGNAGERFPDLAHGLIEQAPFNGVLNELRERSLFESLGAKIGA